MASKVDYVFRKYYMVNQENSYDINELKKAMYKCRTSMLFVFDMLEGMCGSNNYVRFYKTEKAKELGITFVVFNAILKELERCNIIKIVSKPRRMVELYINSSIIWKGKTNDLGECKCFGSFTLPKSI